MSKKCSVCGESIGGLLVGMPEPPCEMVEKGKALGVYQEGMCAACLSKAIYHEENPRDKSHTDGKQLLERALPLVFCTPSPVPAAMQDLGLVTGYCILGTGPLSTLFSTVTDTFGMKSNVYLEKPRLAEKDALDKMKIEALKLGADAIYAVRVNLAEATSGHGMLMVSVSGAAVRTTSPLPEIQQVIHILEQYSA